MSALLQVLWTGREFQDLSLSKFELEIWKREADKLLATFQSWANYRQSFLNGPIREGTFALAKKYQLQAAASKDENFQPSVAFSPIANRTRAKVGNLAQKLRAAQLQTPTKSTGRASTSSEVPGTPEVEDSPFQTPGPEKLTPLMYPQTKKEQITLHRKSFKAVFEDAAFKARTNGYLEDGGSSERVRALIEVKPVLRRKKLNPIRMQEAAQMVAWIMSDPDPTGALNLPGRRLHISQDRHQIFITFAEYDSSYIQYLNNTLPPNAPRSFLTMHEFGPWNTSVRSEMESIGGILLAIALRAYADAAQPSK